MTAQIVFQRRVRRAADRRVAGGGLGGDALPGVVAAEPVRVMVIDDVSPTYALAVGALGELSRERARREQRLGRLAHA